MRLWGDTMTPLYTSQSQLIEAQRYKWEPRFWAKVSFPRNLDECWVWQGKKTRGRWKYGRFIVAGAERMATHVILALLGRPVPSGKLVMHSCDNPPCVNPTHLKAGTVLDNNRDMLVKGRYIGRRTTSKLTPEIVREIRAVYLPGKTNKKNMGLMTELKKKYGVSKSTIHRVGGRLRGGWGHVV